jgi:uncharacterized membrane protein
MRPIMKSRLLVITCALLLLLASVDKVQGQSVIQYTLQINNDNSATWKIIQVADINASVDSLSDFQQRILALVDAAKSETQREMTLNEDSLQMVTTIFWETQSKTIEYTFKWENFSVTENSKIVFGDVFRVANFFSQLYGDGRLLINYPPTYAINSVSPTPSNQNSTLQTLEWHRTQDFIKGEPNVVLQGIISNQNVSDWQQYIVIALGSVTIIAGVLTAFYVFRRRNRKKNTAQINTVSDGGQMDSGEETIIKVLRSSGGNLNQSIIAERCRFSKAKTSQLLSALEQRGVVRRYKKGRDKIVTLNEPE